METNEIVKALRVCAAAGSCADCPCCQTGERCARKDTEAANLIEKQAMEIQALREVANSLKAALSAMEQDLRRAASGWDGCQFCAHFCNDGKPVYRPDEEYLAYCEECDGDCCCFEWRGFVGVELKTTRYAQAVKNCAGVTEEKQMTLW